MVEEMESTLTDITLENTFNFIYNNIFSTLNVWHINQQLCILSKF